MRDRLIELLTYYYSEDTAKTTTYFTQLQAENIADYLLENGVIVPPVKVGDTVYETRTGKVLAFEVYSIENYDVIVEDELYIVCENDRIFNIHDFGNTVFLTKEEAEKALGGVQE